jgi:MoxR-like ATPase
MEATTGAVSQQQTHERTSCWCIYVGRESGRNFDIARAQGIWGARRDWFRDLRAGDRVLFAHHLTSDQSPVPRGYPRVATTADLSGLARSVVQAEVTSDPFKASDRVWSDDIYPYRFRFREVGSTQNVNFNDQSYPVAVVEAVRLSCIQQARPFRADGANTPSGERETKDVLPPPDLIAVQAQFAAALRRSHVSFGPRHDDVVRAFVASLATKPLVILTGLSGSGKTQIALRFGDWLGRDRSLVVPVRPDWTGSEALFGYEDALQPPRDGRRAWSVPEALKFMLRAANDSGNPYLLVLDEMNLAHVERYFADVLSGMESERGCLPNLRPEDDGQWRLIPGRPGRIPVPRNLFIVGTVNVDETTYLFSPKVLDRANTFEFRVDTEDLLVDAHKPLECEPGASGLVRGFLAVATDDEWQRNRPAQGVAAFEQHLKTLHSLLAEGGFEFGHHVFYEGIRFAAMLDAAGDPDPEHAFDLQIMQKVLPRIHGSRRRLEPTLCALGRFCFDLSFEPGSVNDTSQRFNPLTQDPGASRLPISFEKVRRMTRDLQADGYTSFTG